MINKANYFFGIDFGTTHSAVVCCAKYGDATEKFFCGDELDLPIRSAVAIDKNTGKIYTGRRAWSKKTELSESCEYIASVKTMLDEKDRKWEIAGEIWTPVKVATELFKALKENVRDRVELEMDTATIAIPIGFSPEKRAKLREAAQLAGIKVVSFISEPTAAFFANYNELRAYSNIAVFDWGGGTLDVSILKNEEGKVSELATARLPVAGKDIDEKIARRVHSSIATKKNKQIAFEDMPATARARMLDKSEAAKRSLTDNDRVRITFPSYGEYGLCNEELKYDEFAKLIEPEVKQAIGCLEKAIKQSGLNIDRLDKIVYLGRNDNLRPLISKLRAKYGEDKLYFPTETDPMWNVAQGAAELAANPGAYYANQSIGIILSDNSYFEFLKPGTELNDWNMTCRFALVDTSQEARFVFSGSPDIDNSEEKYRVLPIPSYGFVQEQIEVHASVDDNMVFKVEAKSTMKSGDYKRIWEYPKLKFYYKV